MLSQKETVALIRPYYPQLLQILARAKQRLTIVDTERHALRKTTIANLYRDFAVDEARIFFSDMESQGVSIIEESDSSFYIEFSGFNYGINGSAWLRIKKVDGNFLTANIPTRKANKFNSQERIGFTQQPYLTGVDWKKSPKTLQPTHINMGHQWDELGTGIQDVVLTCPESNYSLAWMEHLGGDALEMGIGIAGGDNVSTFPVRLEVTQERPKRVSAKITEKKEKVKKDGTES